MGYSTAFDRAKKQDLKASLNLEVGGSKGTNAEDTYIKMLSSIVRVTESEAKGIVAFYPTLNALYSSWDELVEAGKETEAELMLVGCAVRVISTLDEEEM